MVFILSYERPEYMWAMLDCFYRETKHPAKFVIADNNSQNPAVRRVIRGFERRGMFHAVHLFDENRPDRMPSLLKQYQDQIGEFFCFLETDVMVRSTPDWLTIMAEEMRANPNLWMLGAMADPGDFVDYEWARSADPALKPAQVDFLVKPSRSQHVTSTASGRKFNLAMCLSPCPVFV